MPNTTSAKKAVRQNEHGHKRNLERKRKMKSTIKKYKKLVDAVNKKEAGGFLPEVYKVLDKLAKVSYVKKNKVRRLKSRLARKLKESNEPTQGRSQPKVDKSRTQA